MIALIRCKNGNWTMDIKKQQQTLYCKFIFVFWVVCFEQNIIYKQVSMSILAILATARVTCSVTTSDR